MVHLGVFGLDISVWTDSIAPPPIHYVSDEICFKCFSVRVYMQSVQVHVAHTDLRFPLKFVLYSSYRQLNSRLC